MRVIVIVSAAAASSICDVNGACAAANTVLSIPASTPVGTIYELNWPMASGIRVEPGAGVTLAVSYN
jgi:hypothetical protein